jgi:hypothetical protein
LVKNSLRELDMNPPREIVAESARRFEASLPGLGCASGLE